MQIQDARDLGIQFSLGTRPAFLPLLSVCVEEFELIHEAFCAKSAVWGKELSLDFGKGISYQLRAYFDKDEGHSVEVVISSPGDCFTAPVTITVSKYHAPEGDEHDENCPFHDSYVLETDENGWNYILDDAGDKWYSEDFECYCERVAEDEPKVFVLGANGEDLALDEASAYVKSLFAGF